MQFKLARAAIAVALLSTAAGALISQGGRQAAAADAAVTIQDFAFTPATVTVAAGGAVQWTNMQAGVQHAVTADDGSFDSGRLGTGQSFSMTVTKAGSFTYHCTVHPSLMMGTVVVTAASTSG